MANDISNTDDIIDVRDIIERVEALEDDIAVDEELATLVALLDDLKGCGGDHQWRGDWYPINLVRDTYFTTYAQELAEDIGAVNPEASWPHTCIDWDKAARDLLVDYAAVEFDGVTYWYR